MCIPKPNHKKLIDDCYPAPKALVTAGPEFRPNSNDVGRLTYYAQNKPAKLAKLGRVLESKALADSRAVKASGAVADKGKPSLMITLAITKNLLTECKEHLNYFIQPAQSIIASALDAALPTSTRPRDLEISARAASVFYALASFIDPATTTIDAGFANLVKSFGTLCVERPAASDATTTEDTEQRNRTRLIGLGALAGAVSSDVLYSANSTTLFSSIVPCLVENTKINRVSLDWLYSQAKKATERTPSYAEFNISKKPLAIRRTRSISIHVAGEKGPSVEDVISASIGTLRGLLRHGDATHVQAVVNNIIAWLDGTSVIAIPLASDERQIKSQWENTDWCCWLAQSLCSWTCLQYRFVVFNTFVDHLVESCEATATIKHLSLIEMARSILTGQLSLIGLSTLDTLSNLAALVVRRVYNDPRDSLLPPLVDCISGLGVHVYYADQINDIAEEISGRIAALQMPDSTADTASITTHRKSSQGIHHHIHQQRIASAGPEQRDESIRVLLFCLMGVLHATHQSSGEIQKPVDGHVNQADAAFTKIEDQPKGKATASDHSDTLAISRAGTRNRVSPAAMLPTANLLASSNHAVRLAYAQTLITLFRDEFDPEPLQHGTSVFNMVSVDERVAESIGLVHALAVAVHVMCLSKTLTLPPALAVVRDSPLEVLVQLETINGDTGRPESLNSGVAPAGSGVDVEATSALPVDYVVVAQALEHLITALPVSCALALTPALLALDRDAGSRWVVDGASTAATSGLENQRRLSSRLVVARALEKLASAFDASALVKASQSVSAQIPSLGVEPGPSPCPSLTVAPEVVPFSAMGGINNAGESSNSSSPSIQPNIVVDGLASSQKLQHATKLDSTVLRQWLQRDWSVSIAVDEALAGSHPFFAVSLPSTNHVSRRASTTPMNGATAVGGETTISNGLDTSSASITNSVHVATTGVNDLREALAASSPNLAGSNGHTVDSSISSRLGGTGLSALDVAERRASRRESRRTAPVRPGANGSANKPAVAVGVGVGIGIGIGILDSLHVGFDDDTSTLGFDSSPLSNKTANTSVAPPSSALQPPYST